MMLAGPQIFDDEFHTTLFECPVGLWRNAYAKGVRFAVKDLQHQVNFIWQLVMQRVQVKSSLVENLHACCQLKTVL